MKKNIIYCVDVVSKEGVIVECQCECGVGMGPSAHCKHVQVVLCALLDFCSSKSFYSYQTCTQQLQTFHRAKQFYGSPKRSSDLILRKKQARKSIYYRSSFDPRPSHLIQQPSYQSQFNNLCISHQALHPSTHLPMPILQIIPPANIFAAVHDHTYSSHIMQLNQC